MFPPVINLQEKEVFEMRKTTPLPTGLGSESQSVEPTATPWRVSMFGDRPEIEGEMGDGEGGTPCYHVATMGFGHVQWDDFDPDTQLRLKSDAGLIVKAVNAHDAMVTAGNAMMKALRNARDMYPDQWQQIVTPAICTAWDQTKAALKLAESEGV